ncbi:DUF3231 family protein [Desulfotomaculum copahuensis]|uniref:DUF3231 family protein n=1 Tax=Desulfotomaculum copahuensis TaxID=1838280 RepID=A0A1B7LDX6_9FIRM|nr:DUF3231 family protein [Desulfotomaculum copahuensis]OAT81279.1 hypothetical protein A6M21_00335 [Desulfotomaculum copahuensis]
MSLLEKIITRKDDQSSLDAGEAHQLWAVLRLRYDTVELIDLFLNHAGDSDLKVLLQRGLNKVVMPQINKLEESMNHYKIPLPARPPKSINTPTNQEVIRDEMIFRVTLAGSQTALHVHIKTILIATNDALRNMFMGFMTDELHLYDDMVKYGKVKNWLGSAPEYKMA